MYGNEAGVGQALAAYGGPATTCSSPPSSGTTTHGLRLRRCGRSTPRWTSCGLDYLDLYLIHWPLPRPDRYVEAWKAMRGAARRRPDHEPSASPTSRSRPPAAAVRRDRWFPADQPDRAAPAPASRSCPRASTPSTASPPRPGRPLGQGKGLLEDPAIVGDRREARRTPAQVGAALAPPAGQRRDPQVRDAVPDRDTPEASASRGRSASRRTRLSSRHSSTKISSRVPK